MIIWKRRSKTWNALPACSASKSGEAETQCGTSAVPNARRRRGGADRSSWRTIWARKDNDAWSILKGEYADGEDPWEVAQREFTEETGLVPPAGPRIEFDPVRQPSGKVLTVFAVRGDLDVTDAHSNTFEIEWPTGSGRTREFPEIDRVQWFSLADARGKLLKGQRPILDLLVAGLHEG